MRAKSSVRNLNVESAQDTELGFGAHSNQKKLSADSTPFYQTYNKKETPLQIYFKQ